MVIILATGSEARGFKPCRARWIFSERIIPEYDFLRKGSKAIVLSCNIYTGCIKRSGQSLWWWFRTLLGTKNPNTLFPNSSLFLSYATITHLPSLHSMAILSLRSVANCLYLVNCLVSPSLLAPTSSKGWLEQMLKMSPSRTNTCFILLHITQSALVYLHGSRVNLCNELLPASYFHFVHILLHAAPEEEVQWC